MLLAYFIVNAVIYAAFSVWCALAPQQTATFLGLGRLNPAGEAEYLTVYGGLQGGLAVFYLLAALLPVHQRTALMFSVCLYGGLVLFRSLAIAGIGWSQLGNARFPFILEVLLLLAALALFLRLR